MGYFVRVPKAFIDLFKFLAKISLCRFRTLQPSKRSKLAAEGLVATFNPLLLAIKADCVVELSQ
jgi:hypothetical protein